jgi:hypothetical protein
MKRLYFISILALFFAPMSFAQKVYSVEYENQADVKVFVVDYENQADLKIFFVEYENQSGWRNNAKKHLLY